MQWRGVDPTIDIGVLTETKMVDGIYTIYLYSKASQSIKTFTTTSRHALGHVFGRYHSDLYSIMSPIVRDDDAEQSEFLSVCCQKIIIFLLL